MLVYSCLLGLWMNYSLYLPFSSHSSNAMIEQPCDLILILVLGWLFEKPTERKRDFQLLLPA